ncbi:MAG TPA: flagellar basal body-associated FliL family protein [Terriglobales bacterium]|nr:flagellar basal body-associated FliL family protein [Terriglobales bacterium]
MAEEKTTRNGKSATTVLLVITAALIAAGATGAFFLLRHRTSQASPAPEVQKVKAVMHLEPFVLNTADEEQRAYLRVGIDVGLLSQSDDPKEDEATSPTSSSALARDTILSVLTEVKAEEVMTTDGKVRLKNRLLKALQERAPELGVHEIYFTEFLIQN